jgi:hypothetical protein
MGNQAHKKTSGRDGSCSQISHNLWNNFANSETFRFQRGSFFNRNNSAQGKLKELLTLWEYQYPRGNFH